VTGTKGVDSCDDRPSALATFSAEMPVPSDRSLGVCSRRSCEALTQGRRRDKRKAPSKHLPVVSQHRRKVTGHCLLRTRHRLSEKEAYLKADIIMKEHEEMPSSASPRKPIVGDKVNAIAQRSTPGARSI